MCRVLQGKRANLYIDMLSMTMKLGQGDVVLFAVLWEERVTVT